MGDGVGVRIAWVFVLLISLMRTSMFGGECILSSKHSSRRAPSEQLYVSHGIAMRYYSLLVSSFHYYLCEIHLLHIRSLV